MLKSCSDLWWTTRQAAGVVQAARVAQAGQVGQVGRMGSGTGTGAEAGATSSAVDAAFRYRGYRRRRSQNWNGSRCRRCSKLRKPGLGRR